MSNRHDQVNCQHNTPALFSDRAAIAPARTMRAALAGRIALAIANAGKGGRQFLPQRRKVAFHPRITRDQNVIMIWQAFFRQRIPQQFAKSPLQPVANNGVADSLSDGDAISFATIIIGPRKKDKSRTRNAQPPIRSKKVCAGGNNGGLGGVRIGHIGQDSAKTGESLLFWTLSRRQNASAFPAGIT